MTSDLDSGKPSWLRDKAATLFGIDPRSLACFRMALASLLLVDLALRVPDIRAFYTDQGILPIQLIRDYYDGWRWSLYFLDGSFAFQVTLFSFAAVFAIAMLVGYRTRLATIASWIMLASLHTRMPFILNDGDVYLRVLMFWGMFLPLGQVWSLDARRRAPGSSGWRRVISVGTVAVLLQTCLVYWSTGYAKCNAGWFGGDAMCYVMGMEFYARPLGTSLLNFPILLRVMGVAAVLLELAGPTLVWLPWFTPRVRLATIACFAGLHMGIELTMMVGLFSYIAITAWIPFLPREFWESRALRWLSARWPVAATDRRAQSASAPAVSTPAAAPRKAWAGRTFFFFGQGLCLGCLLFVVVWSLHRNFNWNFPQPLAPGIGSVASLTNLGQQWQMYGVPPTGEIWYVYRARLRNGQIVDVMQGGAPIQSGKPPRIADTFWNHRWRLLHFDLLRVKSAPLRQSIAEYMCRRWNARHGEDEQVVVLDVYCRARLIGRDHPPENYQQVTFARVELGAPEETSNFAEALGALERGEYFPP